MILTRGHPRFGTVALTSTITMGFDPGSTPYFQLALATMETRAARHHICEDEQEFVGVEDATNKRN